MPKVFKPYLSEKEIKELVKYSNSISNVPAEKNSFFQSYNFYLIGGVTMDPVSLKYLKYVTNTYYDDSTAGEAQIYVILRPKSGFVSEYVYLFFQEVKFGTNDQIIIQINEDISNYDGVVVSLVSNMYGGGIHVSGSIVGSR